MDQLRPPEIPELAVEEANEWRPLHHPQPAWCPQQGPASSEYNLSMSFILQFNERAFSLVIGIYTFST